MLNPIEILPIVLGQWLLPQSLQRTPERFAEMTEHDSVEQFNHALQSKLVIAYAAAIKLIHQCRRTTGGKAVDLCCGPGHFTLFLAKYLGYEEVIGVDISETMIGKAKANAADWGLSDRVTFLTADVLQSDLGDGEFDLVTCNDAAHHLTGANSSSMEKVAQLIGQMDKMVVPMGTILLMDLVRLKSEWLTERYTRAIGKDYLAKGWNRFYEDFCESMRAAWTPDELESLLNDTDQRRWQMIVPRLLPTVQIAISVPNDNKKLRLQSGVPWENIASPIPKELRLDWALFQSTLQV